MADRHAKRKAISDPEKFGYWLSEIFYGRTAKDEEPKSKDNGLPVNIRLIQNDVNLIDRLGKRFGMSRAAILSAMIENDIEEMFFAQRSDDQIATAVEVDNLMTEGGFSHIYRKKTWLLEVLELPANYGNPGYANSLFPTPTDSSEAKGDEK